MDFVQPCHAGGEEITPDQRVDIDPGIYHRRADVVQYMPGGDEDSGYQLEARPDRSARSIQHASQVSRDPRGRPGDRGGHCGTTSRSAGSASADVKPGAAGIDADRDAGSYPRVTLRVASPETPTMITPPDAEKLSPNSSSTRSGRAALPARSIMSAVDLAISIIAS